MIYFDDYGFPCDQTGDVGDSAVMAGILKISPSEFKWQFNLLDYEIKPGVLCRHPFTPPWNNHKNLSRDNTMPLLAALNRLGLHCVAERFFYKRMSAFFFAQNTERDHKGTTKKPYPHIMTGGDPKDEGKFRLFDMPDLLWSPSVLGSMVLAGRIKWLYWLLPVSYVVNFFNIVYMNKKEVNQLIAECSILGTTKLLKKLNPEWETISEKYWGSRNAIEYHEMLLKVVNK